MSAPGPSGRWAEGGARSPEETAAAALLERAGRGADPEPAALERSWRGVAARLARPRRPAPLAVGAGALAVAAAGLALLLARPIPSPALPARLASSSGAVQVSLPGGAWAPAPAGLELPPGSRLRAPDDGASAARLSLARASVLASAGALLSLEALEPQVLLGLRGGAVSVEVEPRPPGEAFAVQTERYRVTVKGTEFSVRERTAEDVEVVVRRGLVEVSGEGGRWQVPAGRRWESLQPDVLAEGARPESPGQAPALPVPLQVASLEVRERPAPSPPLPAASPAAASPSRPPTPAAAPAGVRPAEVPPGVTAAPPVATPPPEPPRAGAPAPGPVPPPATAALSAPPRPLRRELLARAGPQPAQASPAAAGDDAYARAVALAGEGRLGEAAAALEAVSRAPGPHAGLALYELGRLQQVRLGQPDRARETYARYRQEHPRGAMTQEVELSTLELQLQAGQLEAALGTLDGFLRRHPDSERVEELRVLRGDVLRERGDCSGALVEFEQVQAGPQADDATYLAGWCQQRLGRSGAAAATLRGYLERFPSGRHRAEAQASLGQAGEKE